MPADDAVLRLTLMRGDRGDDLAGGDLGAHRQRREFSDDAGARGDDRGLHFHGADHQQGVARGDDVPGPGRHLDDGAGHRRFHRLVAVGHRHRRNRRGGGQGGHAAAESGGLLIEQRQRTGRRPRAAGGCGQFRVLGQQGGARIARADGRIAEDRAQSAQVGRQAGDLKFLQGARRAVQGGG